VYLFLIVLDTGIKNTGLEQRILETELHLMRDEIVTTLQVECQAKND
jgi:hypothetical protein